MPRFIAMKSFANSKPRRRSGSSGPLMVSHVDSLMLMFLVVVIGGGQM